MRWRTAWTFPAAVFFVSLAFLWWLVGNRFVLTNDEGIFLSQAARIAEGEVLYRDLWGLTGPGAYWLLAITFQIAGISLAAAHAVLVIELAIIATLIAFVTRELAGGTAASLAVFVFLTMNAADPAMMTNNHRWDAGTFAIAGFVAIWRGHPFAGGFLLALAVWTTPTLAICAATGCAAAWLIRQPVWRVVAGGAVGAAAGVLALYLADGLPGFIADLMWAKSNYSEANRLAYGSVIGGYGALFAGADGWADLGMRAVVVAGLTLPVWLPPLCGILLIRSRDRNLWYFAICGASMIASCSPRLDVGHLIFAAPLFYPVAAAYLDRARWAIVPVGALASLFLLSAVIQRFATETVVTPAGTVRVDRETAQFVRFLTEQIRPGEPVFVYPYPPIAYFITRARNVSRFPLLQPGLFTEAEERIAAGEILRHTPSKIVYQELAKEDFLRIWPASDPSRLQLRYLHSFVESHFEPGARFRNFRIYTPPIHAKTAPRSN